MEENESKSKLLKRIFRSLDFFGESFTFRYKDEDKHSSVLGGIICSLFYILSFIYIVINFVPFSKRENFTLQYYAVNVDTEKEKEINLTDNNVSFSFGLKCDEIKEYQTIEDLFDITVEYTLNKDKDNKTTIDINLCKEGDFPDEFDDPINENFSCINPEANPKGIFTDDYFSYYTISVISKSPNNITHNKLINNFLLENDCKLQYYYMDIGIDLNNYTNPFHIFLNSMFLQLNPTLIQKKNIYYTNYHLINDSSPIRLRNEKEIPKNQVGLSRVEDYSVYKGLERAAEPTYDYENYAKIYIRADNRKIYIKRRYPDFMEFYADNSGWLLSIFWVLGVIMAYYDRVKTNHSISKRLFYFEGIKNNKFDQFKIIKELIASNEKLEKEKQFEEENHISTYHIPIPSNTNILSRRSSEASNNFVLNNTNNINNTESKVKVEKKVKEQDLIDYSSYNILEMMTSFNICFCQKKKFKNKINLIKQANTLIDEKLDVVFYIRNMFLFEAINKAYLENKNILNFLSRPIIYLKGKLRRRKSKNIINDHNTNASFEINEEAKDKIEEKKDIQILEYFEGDIYKTAYKLVPNILSNKITNLILQPGKTNNQKKLISCLKDHLKGV